MDREEIIRMAREAGISVATSLLLPAPDGQVEALERFAALVAAHEREACAKVCEDAISSNQVGKNVCTNLAAAIRARSKS